MKRIFRWDIEVFSNDTERVMDDKKAIRISIMRRGVLICITVFWGSMQEGRMGKDESLFQNIFILASFEGLFVEHHFAKWFGKGSLGEDSK